MSRRGDQDWGRPSRVLYGTPEQKAVLEAENGLLLFDHTLELFRRSGGALRLTPLSVRTFHRIAVQGIYGCAGEFRRDAVTIERSKHVPPRFPEIPRLVEEMCVYANASHGSDDQAIHIAAYLLRRVNWIHPFFGGNGRVARSLSYLALCVGFGMELPGTYTIVEQIERDPEPYYTALEDADRAEPDDPDRLRTMESLLSDLLVRQLESAV